MYRMALLFRTTCCDMPTLAIRTAIQKHLESVAFQRPLSVEPDATAPFVDSLCGFAVSGVGEPNCCGVFV